MIQTEANYYFRNLTLIQFNNRKKKKIKTNKAVKI